jgi:hypothetical protein
MNTVVEHCCVSGLSRQETKKNPAATQARSIKVRWFVEISTFFAGKLKKSPQVATITT